MDNGPNDSIHQIFHGNSDYYIVRESIQNSLDAVDDGKLPVKVAFSFTDIDISSYPEFLRIEEHILSAKDYFSDNETTLFDRMLNYLNECKSSGKISCLCIADYNTKGMDYEPGKTNSSFYAFLRAAGVSAKSNRGSGGSFGFGKGAYFALSPLKTLLVSSMDTARNFYFEGAIRLTTHPNPNNKDEILTNCGYYDNNNGEPVVDATRIPEQFIRRVPGTDIYIMGLNPETQREESMIRSVLNNFWLAIHCGDLEVDVNGRLITSGNLEEMIKNYYPNNIEKGSPSDITTWNPRPYYTSVKYAKSTDEYRIINGSLETLGDVSLHLYLDNNLPNRIAYFRKPKMVVYKRTNNTLNGYAGVFLCENERGNNILRSLENPAHNEWNEKNYPLQKNSHEDPLAKRTILEINDFITGNLKALSSSSVKKKTTFLNLDDYLNIPEDLISNEEIDVKGENGNSISGEETKEQSFDETGNQTTETKGIIPYTVPTVIKPKIKQAHRGEPTDECGDYISSAGGSNDTHGGNTPGKEGDNSTSASNKDSDKKIKKLVPIKFRQVAQHDSEGVCFHYLMINSTKAINSAEIEIVVASDSGDEDKVPIIYSDKGKIGGDGNIKELEIFPGDNIVKIRFSDNLKYSLKIKAYEV